MSNRLKKFFWIVKSNWETYSRNICNFRLLFWVWNGSHNHLQECHRRRLGIVYVNHSSIIFVFARKSPHELNEIKAGNFFLILAWIPGGTSTIIVFIGASESEQMLHTFWGLMHCNRNCSEWDKEKNKGTKYATIQKWVSNPNEKCSGISGKWVRVVVHK